MKKALLAAAAALHLSAGLAGAVTLTPENFKTLFTKQARKYTHFAPTDGFKGVCTCLDGSSSAGYLVLGGVTVGADTHEVVVWCAVPQFDDAGVFKSTHGCEPFAVLGK